MRTEDWEKIPEKEKEEIIKDIKRTLLRDFRIIKPQRLTMEKREDYSNSVTQIMITCYSPDKLPRILKEPIKRKKRKDWTALNWTQPGGLKTNKHKLKLWKRFLTNTIINQANGI